MAKASKVRPSHLPHGRWLGDFEPLSEPERRLVECCARGEFCTLSKDRPKNAMAGNEIRASLIRFLALGGDEAHPVHEHGVRLEGAWIEDELSLDGAKGVGNFELSRCHFSRVPRMQDAQLLTLGLEGSKVPGLNADRLSAPGGVYLRSGFESTGEVRLPVARIGSCLDCSDAKFGNAGSDGNPAGDALWMDGVEVAGNVLLSDKFVSSAPVRMIGAQITGNLYCNDATFGCLDNRVVPHDAALTMDGLNLAGSLFLNAGFLALGPVRLLGARIGGLLDCTSGRFENRDQDGNPGGDALNADGMELKNGLFVRGAQFVGQVDLSGAQVGSLVDGYSPSAPSDDACWPAGGLILDGFYYGRIAAGPTDATRRIAWLKKQIPNHLEADFCPQPWEQLIRVLREMGHPHEARSVAIAKQDAITARTNGFWRIHGRKIFRIAAGYGYEPWRLVVGAIAAWLVFALAYYMLGIGNMVCTADRWCAGNMLRPLSYSLDVILPIDFGLVDKGAPGEAINLRKLPANTAVRVLTGIETTLGWVLAGVLAAIAGGLVKKD